MDSADRFLLDFHREQPGCTSHAFAAGAVESGSKSSYDMLADLACDSDVLDLGCGDGHLLSLLRQRPGTGRIVGLDFSATELHRGRAVYGEAHTVCANAQHMPLADRSFSLVVSHLAFQLMSNPERVVAEIVRVLRPQGIFASVVGGGPKLGGTFEVFLDLVKKMYRQEHKVPRIGDIRTRTSNGLAELFSSQAGFVGQPEIRDFYVDFGGSFEILWPRLATVYDLAFFRPDEIKQLQEAFYVEMGRPTLNQQIPCLMALRLVCTRRSGDGEEGRP